MFLDFYMFMHGHGAAAAQFYIMAQQEVYHLQLKIPFRFKHVHITQISSVLPDSSLPPMQESKLQSHGYQCFKQSAQHT